jgi:chemotaxis signal transduction protein
MFRDGAERFLVFRIGAERFAVTLSAVDEVVDAPQVRPLPDAAEHVMGIAMIRGALVVVYDPRSVLNVSGTVDDAALLFSRGGTRVALAIGGVQDTMLIDPSELRPPPGGEVSEKLLVGVVRRDRELIAVLDAERLVAATVAVAEMPGGRA